jgi:hypothetical protein
MPHPDGNRHFSSKNHEKSALCTRFLIFQQLIALEIREQNQLYRNHRGSLLGGQQ